MNTVKNELIRLLLSFIIAVLSGIAPGFISELGGMMNDNLISLFVLTPILLLIISNEKDCKLSNKKKIGLIITAGFIMGVGVGLKPTIGIYALSSAVALLLLFDTWEKRLIIFLIYSAAGITGGITSAGFWWYELWSKFGNPFLPYFNSVFHSPFVQSIVFNDTRFYQVHFWEYILWPFISYSDTLRVSESHFTDIRFVVIYILLIVFIISLVVKKNNSKTLIFNNKYFLFLLTFFILSYLFWMKSFSFYRYIISIELFSIVIIFGLVERIWFLNKYRIIVFSIIAIAIILVMKPPTWGRTFWENPYIDVKIKPELKISENAMVVMLGSEAMSYIIPFFPKTIRFLRPEGNLLLRDNDVFFEQIKAMVQRQKSERKEIFIMYHTNDEFNKSIHFAETSSRLGINLDSLTLYSIKNNINDDTKIVISKVNYK